MRKSVRFNVDSVPAAASVEQKDGDALPYHARASTAAATDWPQIAGLYSQLRRHSDSAVIQLNQAVAISMASGPEAGLRSLEPLAGERDFILEQLATLPDSDLAACPARCLTRCGRGHRLPPPECYYARHQRIGHQQPSGC